MEKIRIAIIGIGNMGTTHSKNIFAGKVPDMELAAICDTDPKRLEWAKESFGDKVRLFDTTNELYKNPDLYDAVVIATPHYDHPTLAIQAFALNKHVLTEKPAGVYTKQVREMNEAAEMSGKVFGIMYNQRTNPVYQKVKELVESGQLGSLKRMVWIITNWYRSQSYHDSSAWRSTWEGEGGGVLINQCPHNLDLWQWMVGMPTRIRSFCYFGKYHNIETEDDVTAFAEYENGMTATFMTSTGEAPGTNRLEIVGDMGKLIVDDKDKITFYRNVVSEREFDKTWTKGFGAPECWICQIPPTKSANEQHIGIFKNFAGAILRGEELLASGIEGIKGLSISNAIHLSTWLDNWVDLPVDEELYYDKLQEKIKNSTFKKEVRAAVFSVDGTYAGTASKK